MSDVSLLAQGFVSLASHNVDGITLGQARPKGECADRKIAVRSSIYT